MNVVRGVKDGECGMKGSRKALACLTQVISAVVVRHCDPDTVPPELSHWVIPVRLGPCWRTEDSRTPCLMAGRSHTP